MHLRPFLFALCLSSTCLSHAQQPAAAAPHTFTATDGRKLTATIVGKTDTTVTIRRAEDGLEFVLPLDSISAADQAFIASWGTKPDVAPAPMPAFAEPKVTTYPSGLVKTWMLEPQWDGAGMFGEGLAPVKLGGKWGFIDETGKMVIEPAWDEALSFADGLAPVWRDGKWGYIDKTGKVVIEPTWDDAEVFSGGVASVVAIEKKQFIDTTGKVIGNPKAGATPSPKPPEGPPGVKFVELATLRFTNYSLADKAVVDTMTGGVVPVRDPAHEDTHLTGVVVVPLTRPQTDRLAGFWKGPSSLSEPIPAAASSRRYGLVNHLGKVVVKPMWEDAEILSADLVAFRVDGKFGLMDASGQIILPPKLEKAETVKLLSPNLIAIQVDGKFGLLNGKGKVVLPATIENIKFAAYHDEESVTVRQGMDFKLLEIKTGKITSSLGPSRADAKNLFPDDFVPFQENKLWGVKAKDGSILVEAQYGWVVQTSKDRFWVHQNTKDRFENNNWALMSETGKLLTEFEWWRVGSKNMPSDGLSLVVKGNPAVSSYMHEEDGKLLLPLSPGNKSGFAHGAAMVWGLNESGLINTKGEWIFKSNAEAELSEIGHTSGYQGFFEHGLALIETPLKWGFVKLSQGAK